MYGAMSGVIDAQSLFSNKMMKTVLIEVRGVAGVGDWLGA